MTAAMEFKDELKQAYLIGVEKKFEERKKMLAETCERLESMFKNTLKAAADKGEASAEFKLKTNIEYFAIFELAKKYNLSVLNNYALNTKYYGKLIISGWDK